MESRSSPPGSNNLFAGEFEGQTINEAERDALESLAFFQQPQQENPAKKHPTQQASPLLNQLQSQVSPVDERSQGQYNPLHRESQSHAGPTENESTGLGITFQTNTMGTSKDQLDFLDQFFNLDNLQDLEFLNDEFNAQLNATLNDVASHKEEESSPYHKRRSSDPLVNDNTQTIQAQLALSVPGLEFDDPAAPFSFDPFAPPVSPLYNHSTSYAQTRPSNDQRQQLRPRLRIDTNVPPMFMEAAAPVPITTNLNVDGLPLLYTAEEHYNPDQGYYTLSDLPVQAHRGFQQRDSYDANHAIRDNNHRPRRSQCTGPAAYLAAVESKKRAREDDDEDDNHPQGSTALQQPRSNNRLVNKAIDDTSGHPLERVDDAHLLSYIKVECRCYEKEKVPRPANSFMLYRSHFNRLNKARDSNQPKMSQKAKVAWDAASLETKNYWKTKANEEKAKHKQLYPNYQFKPKSQHQKNLMKFGNEACTCGAYNTNMAHLRQVNPASRRQTAYARQQQPLQTPGYQHAAPQRMYPLVAESSQQYASDYYSAGQQAINPGNIPYMNPFLSDSSLFDQSWVPQEPNYAVTQPVAHYTDQTDPILPGQYTQYRGTVLPVQYADQIDHTSYDQYANHVNTNLLPQDTDQQDSTLPPPQQQQPHPSKRQRIV
ncbi:hypothetical protein AMS68_001945 [Peltaster fructicola]|uniref:HMG box domain-containing protein n=1 Tax=Peltaster fructicola TaxID=286661 RepID=A0A6H0XP73_9PEZI|nr:hypothetical protein AMS68_001945 [Peltaster fructicola]